MNQVVLMGIRVGWYSCREQFAMHSNSAGIGDKKDWMRPEHQRLGESLAGRLGAPSGLAAEQPKGLTIADITKVFPYGIDPKILLFRHVCGTVVKTDSSTGVDAPVPFATVQVEDTEGSFLGYFPASDPQGWSPITLPAGANAWLPQDLLLATDLCLPA